MTHHTAREITVPRRFVPEVLPRVIPKQERMLGHNKKDRVRLLALGNGRACDSKQGRRTENLISFMKLIVFLNLKILQSHQYFFFKYWKTELKVKILPNLII
jgi:hypothetical protein